MFVHFTDQGGASSPSRIEEHGEEAKRARPCEPVKEIKGHISDSYWQIVKQMGGRRAKEG